jgi:hypothetical protein
MKATLLLSTLVIGLIGVTPSSAQSVSSYSRNFGYPSYALRTRRRCSARRTMGINEAAQRATRKLGAGVVASDVQSEGSSRRRLTPVGARHSSRLCRSPAAVLVAETAPLMARMARFVLGEPEKLACRVRRCRSSSDGFLRRHSLSLEWSPPPRGRCFWDTDSSRWLKRFSPTFPTGALILEFCRRKLNLFKGR